MNININKINILAMLEISQFRLTFITTFNSSTQIKIFKKPNNSKHKKHKGDKTKN